MQNLWLYLHFPNLQLDALFTQENDIRQHALVVLDRRDNKVVQLNQKAREAGITLGMSLATAASLDRELQVLPHQPEVEQAKLREVAESLYLMTCDISFFSHQGLLLRIHNMLSLYGGLSAYWRTLRTQLAPFRLGYHYATGLSPLAAKMLATSGCNKISEYQDELTDWVAQCTLLQTDLPDKTQQALGKVGIRQVGELLAIPLSDIARRFDIQLVTYLGRLTGEFRHPVEFFHPPETFERYLELMYEIDNAQTLLHPLKHLLLALEQFLRLRDRLTQTLSMIFHQRDNTPLQLEVGSQQGEYRHNTWLELTRLKLEQLKLQSPVFAITLKVSTTFVRCPDEGNLFGARQGNMSRLQLVSLLQAKLGEAAVRSPALLDDPRPDVAISTTLPFRHDAAELSLMATRPSFVFHPPRPLTEKVSVISGPERLQTGWWDNQPVERDYFIAHTHQYQWYWIFRTPQRHWYIHGIFS